MDRLFQNNTVLRIVALLLAIALWLGVHAPNTSNSAPAAGVGISQQFPKTIQVETPNNLVAVSVQPAHGAVVVHVNPQNIASLPGEMVNVSLIADARGLSAGTHEVHVAALHMPGLNGSTFSVQPAYVTVTLAPEVTKSLPVDVSVSGFAAATYTAGTPTTDVAAVQVSGAKANVAQVTKVIAKVSIAGMSHTVNHVAQLVPVNAKGDPVNGVTVSPQTCTVTVPISAPAQTVSLQPEVIGKPASGYAVAGVTVKPQTVQLTGSLQTSTSGVAPALNLPIRVTNLSSTQTLNVAVPLVNGATAANPSTVAVTVQVQKSLSKTFTGIPVAVKNLQGSESVKFPAAHTIDVTVKGPQSVVSQLQASALQVYVDAATLTNSSTTAAIEVLTPSWVEVTRLSAYQVPVQVSNAPQ